MSIKISCIRAYADEVQISNCRNKLESNSESFSKLSSLLALAGNEVRFKMLYLLHEEGELCPCDMADILEMTVPAVSQHIRKMKDGNMIAFRRSGQTLYYSLKEESKERLIPFFEIINSQEIKNQLV